MLDFSQISTISLPIDSIMLLGFYLILGAYTIFSGIFYYHWKSYGTDAKVTAYTLIAFFATTIPLLLVMGVLTFITT
jgi:hypothetical protein